MSTGSGLSELRSDITAGRITISDANITSGSAALTTLNVNSDSLINGMTVGMGAGSLSANTVMGYQALSSNTVGLNQVAIGYQALKSTVTSNENTAVGYQALTANTGPDNSAFGAVALLSNTTGADNNAFGANALYYNSTGSGNVAMGRSAMVSNSTGSYNVALGYRAFLQGWAGGGTGSNNVVIGSSAMRYGVSANNNTAIGYQTGYSVNSGGSNTLLGYQSGYNLSSGSSNIVIGQNVDAPSATSDQQLNIGNLIYGTGIYNGSSVSATPVISGKIGIGTTTPWAQLSVNPNGITGPSFVIGSSTKTDFVVNNGGMVGIGTSNLVTGYALTMQTSSTGENGIFFNDSTGAAAGAIYVNGPIVGANRGLLFRAPGVTGELATGDNFMTYRFNGSGNKIYLGDTGSNSLIQSGHNLNFTTNRGSAPSSMAIPDMTISTGKVGIGTSSPLAVLDIAGANNGTAPLFQISSVASYATTTKMYMDSSGNVAFGTTTLLESFDITGGGLLVRNGVDKAVRLVSTADTSYIQFGKAGVTNGTGDLRIGPMWQVNAVFMTIKNPGGNVGIGTTQPYAKLTVVNTVAATTTLALYPVSGQTANILDVYNPDGTLGSVIDENGSFGIGLTNPGYKLDVVGNASTSADSYFNGVRVGKGGGSVISNTVVGSGALSSASSGEFNVAVGKGALGASTGSTNTIVGYAANGSTSSGAGNTALGYQTLNVAASGNGNTAIGSAALWRLVNGGGNVALGQQAGAYETGSNSFYVNNRNLTDTATEKLGSLLYGTFNTTPSSQTLTINASTSVAQNLQVLGTGNSYFAGNVGIGTTAPGSKLVVSKSSGAVVALASTWADDSSAGVLAEFVDSTASPRRPQLLIVGTNIPSSDSVGLVSASNANTGFAFVTRQSASPFNLFTRMVIQGDGNVGIGTTNPNYKLEVNGTASTTALYLPTTNSANTGIVYKGTDRFIHNFALPGTSGFNTFVGVNSGNFTLTGSTGTQGSALVGIGYIALSSNTTGNYNTASGYQALGSNTSGNSNTAVGGDALVANTIGSSNSAFGYDALKTNGSSNFNTAIGSRSLLVSTGSQNTAVGYNSLLVNVAGSDSVSVGFNSLVNADGNSNTAVGSQSGYTITSGTYNTFLGFNAGYNASQKLNPTNSMALGYGAYTTADNQVVIGNTSVTQTLLNGSVGIGTTSPAQNLSVQGSGLFSGNISSANLTATGTISLQNTTYANQSGIIYKGSTPFIHNFNYGNNNTVTTNGENTFVGINAGNLTMGSTATQVYQSSSNTGIGSSALNANTLGYQNVAVGTNALKINTTGRINTAIGYGALSLNVLSSYNTAIGYGTLDAYNFDGNGNNVAIGSETLGSLTTGSGNTAIGGSTFGSVSSGTYNTIVGYGAAGSVINGSYNTAFGTLALQNSTGESNVAIGYCAGAYETGSNSFYVNNQDQADLAHDRTDSLLYGTFNTTLASQTLTINASTSVAQNLQVLGTGNSYFAGNVGIGTSSPTAKLHVVGSNYPGIIVESTDSTSQAGINLKTLSDSSSTWTIGKRDDGISSTPAASLEFIYGNQAQFYMTPNINSDALFPRGKLGIGSTTPAARLGITQSSNTNAGGIWLAATDGDYRAMFMDTSGVLSFNGGDGTTLNTATLNAAGAWSNASDISYKNNIQDLGSKYGLDTVMKTTPRSYTMKGSNLPQVGFIAQELKPLIPEVVDGTDGSMGISYGNLVAVAFQAIKELNQKVTDLQSQMKNFVFDKLTAKIAYVDDMNVKNLNADRVDVKTATTFHGSMNIDSSVCVDNVCVSKDKFKEFLLQTGGVTYGSAADQAKGINPLLNTVTTVNPTASATTTIEVATTTVPAVSTETATSTPVISTTPTIETIQATTTTLQSEPVTTVQSPIEQTTEPTTATSTSSK